MDPFYLFIVSPISWFLTMLASTLIVSRNHKALAKGITQGLLLLLLLSLQYAIIFRANTEN
jgi:hypothetical protein